MLLVIIGGVRRVLGNVVILQYYETPRRAGASALPSFDFVPRRNADDARAEPKHVVHRRISIEALAFQRRTQANRSTPSTNVRFVFAFHLQSCLAR